VQHASAWTDPRQATNVFQAALDGNVPFLQMYLAAGGSLAVADQARRSPVHFSAAGGHAEMTSLLLAGKASVDGPDEEANTPLFYACERGFWTTAEVLLRHGARTGHQNGHGLTALHVAAMRGQVDCLHLLLQSGESAAAASRDGSTALDLAMQHGHERAVAVLEARALRAQRPGRRVSFALGWQPPERDCGARPPPRRTQPARAAGPGGRLPRPLLRFQEIWASVRRIFTLYLPSLEEGVRED